jgi:hypothetical protein
MGRVDCQDLADDKPVEQHADRSQVLLDGRPGRGALFHCGIAGVGHLQRLDIRSDMERLDIDEPADAVLLEPGEERAHGPVIGHARVVVVDRGGEKIEEPACRSITGIGDHRRHDKRTVQCRRRDRRRGLDNRRQVAPLGAHRDTLEVNFDPRMRTSPNSGVSLT